MASGRKFKSKSIGDAEFFPPDTVIEKVFPFPEYFERQLTSEWDQPDTNTQFPHFVKKLYALPNYANELLQVPPVDGPVVALQSKGLLSEDGHGTIWDAVEKKAEATLKNL